jgi:thioredoxin reductase
MVIRIREDMRASTSFAPTPLTGHNDLYKLVRKQKIHTHNTTIKSFKENQVILENGETVECDLVLLATGYHFTGIDYLGEKYQYLVSTIGLECIYNV